MIDLTINNSISMIKGLTPTEFSQLKELMSYSLSSNMQFFSKSYRSGKKSLLTRTGEFPTGLLYIALQWIEACGRDHNKKDLRIKPKSQEGLFNLSLCYTPHQWQIDASRACSARYRGVVSAVTGSGKSVVIALIINNLQVPTLVVVPTLELKKQLAESLANTFGVDKVGPGLPVWVENVDALKCTEALEGYDCVIIDEFHHSAAKTYRNLNKKAWTRAFYRFGMTATAFRSQDNERLLLESVLSEVIYALGYKAAVDKSYIVPMNAFYVDIPAPSIKKEYNNYASAYSELIRDSDIRNDIICHLLLKFHSNKLSTLCLVKEIAHGENLTLDGAFNFVNGQNDERHLISTFNNRKIDVLIGTHGVLGEGVDTRPCEYVIIATPVKSKNLFMQMVGRAFRVYPGKESATIILLRDRSHRWFKSAFKEQCKILQMEYGIVPAEIKVDTKS